MPVYASAERITERLDALACALREAGVTPDRSARLLATAAEATMHAVTLDVLTSEPEPVRPRPVERPAERAATPVTLAA